MPLILSLGFSLALVAQTPTLAPDELVRRAVENELKANDGSARFMFRARKETPHGSQTRLYVQTRDAMAGLLIAVNDQPLTAAQREAEEAHLKHLASNPDELRRKQKQEKDDADRVNRIVRAMPNAFVYDYDGTEAEKAGAGNELVRLKFKPNPKYSPPSRVELVLTGMQGHVLIDATRYRIAEIDGMLYKEVSFGWGFLGHLDQGGHFHVEQGAVGDGSWEITRMSLNFTGKILIFKSMVIRSEEVYSDFRRVPSDLTFEQGAALLEKQESSTPGNGN